MPRHGARRDRGRARGPGHVAEESRPRVGAHAGTRDRSASPDIALWPEAGAARPFPSSRRRIGRARRRAVRYECDVTQSVCRFNISFARSCLTNRRSHRARRSQARTRARSRALLRERFGVMHGESSAACDDAPVQRAKLRGLQRNAFVALGNVGTRDDADVLTGALHRPEPLVRERSFDGHNEKWSNTAMVTKVPASMSAGTPSTSPAVRPALTRCSSSWRTSLSATPTRRAGSPV